MPRYRRKPTVVEAVQFSGDLPLPEGVVFILNAGYHVKTVNGFVKIEDGEWIITGVKGKRYPCKPDIFKETYELVGEQ